MSPREEAMALVLLRRWRDAWKQMTEAGNARNGEKALAVMKELDEKLLPETSEFLRGEPEGARQ